LLSVSLREVLPTFARDPCVIPVFYGVLCFNLYLHCFIFNKMLPGPSGLLLVKKKNPSRSAPARSWFSSDLHATHLTTHARSHVTHAYASLLARSRTSFPRLNVRTCICMRGGKKKQNCLSDQPILLLTIYEFSTFKVYLNYRASYGISLASRSDFHGR
jgi:hypothetical protein